MSVQRIATRYAKSILDHAIEQKLVDQVLHDMQYMDAALRSRDLYLMMKSPIISAEKKLSLFKRLFSGKISETTESFFEIMIRKNRENHLPEIVETFLDQYKSFRQISTVQVKTAGPLDEGALNIIRQKLSASAYVKKNLEMEVQIDPSLIGGFILEFEGRQYDASIASKLRELRKQFSH